MQTKKKTIPTKWSKSLSNPLDTWRTLSKEQRSKSLKYITKEIKERFDKGLEEYGEKYQGKEITSEIREELIDSLIYLEFLEKKTIKMSRQISVCSNLSNCQRCTRFIQKEGPLE